MFTRDIIHNMLRSVFLPINADRCGAKTYSVAKTIRCNFESYFMAKCYKGLFLDVTIVNGVSIHRCVLSRIRLELRTVI